MIECHIPSMHAGNFEFTTVIGSAQYISALTRMISKKAHMPSSYIQYSVLKDSIKCLSCTHGCWHDTKQVHIQRNKKV